MSAHAVGPSGEVVLSRSIPDGAGWTLSRYFANGQRDTSIQADPRLGPARDLFVRADGSILFHGEFVNNEDFELGIGLLGLKGDLIESRGLGCGESAEAGPRTHHRGRQVDNADKILSLYDVDVHVLTRGKVGAEVEFGNTVLLGENKQGVILDYQVWKEQAPADVHVLVESLERVVVGLKGKVSAVAADRGFASKSNSSGLNEAEIFDAICPRNPQELKERMKDKRFVRMQSRRSQTEARISIVQHGADRSARDLEQ